MAETAGRDFFIAPSKKNVDDFQPLIERDYQVVITAWLKKGWELFVTLPWTIYASAIAYEDIFKEGSSAGTITAEQQLPPSGQSSASGAAGAP